jgi:hypothetical protein
LTNEERLAIFDEIRALNEAKSLRPGDVTVAAYKAALGVTRQQATTHIQRAVEAGVLVAVGLLIDPATGRNVRAWRRRE